jgi:C4-dicarboxylate-specific signal transduction histidine kinase
MDTLFDDVCVLVTAAFALTLVPGFRQPERSLLSRRDQGTALLVFLAIDSRLLKVLMPPFSFQPLVENAVQHGLHASPGAGRLQLVVRSSGAWLELSVSDDGPGVASTEVEQLFFAEGPRPHRAGAVAPAAARLVWALISAGGA